MKNKIRKLVTLATLVSALASPIESTEYKTEGEQEPKVIATMYHCISNDACSYLTIKPELLEKQIDWLKENRKFN